MQQKLKVLRKKLAKDFDGFVIMGRKGDKLIVYGEDTKGNEMFAKVHVDEEDALDNFTSKVL